MPYERLLAKSARVGSRPQTIRKHTAEVIRAADWLVEVTGAAQLRALGLDPDAWLDRFRREVKISALLHDPGKANDHFQGMIQGQPRRVQPQGLRHEAISFLIARTPEIRRWIRPALASPHAIELVLWAIAGHHRKFPPESAPDGAGAAVEVFLRHDEFRAALALGTRNLGLGPPPEFPEDHPLAHLTLTELGGVFAEFQSARREATALMASLPEEERRYVAALKACLICADVAGSIGRRGTEAMVDWIPRAFRRVPTAAQLHEIVAGRLGGARPRPFQEQVADCTDRVALARGGCGSGKTVAAYLWAARQAPGRRVFFCYPTTGTATEGYRDYLRDPALEADLIHGRAEVDKASLGELVRSGVEPDMEPLALGDDEPDRAEPGSPKGRPGGAAEDSAGALEQWSTPLVSCTVDTVLGLVQNNRRGLYAWPSIAGAACVFDEIHAYDEKLFAALLRFLADVPGIPCLLMTASLPADRLRRLQATLERLGQPLDPIPGPQDLEGVRRYQRIAGNSAKEAWTRVQEAHARGEKVLWVVNTVNAALELADDPRATDLGAILYHSRFRYRDRVTRHRAVIDAFAAPAGTAALAITSQVAEMSLDLSADLLVSHLAPIAALIQRLGRLNRRAKPDGSSGTRPFLVYEPDGPLPYTSEELERAKRWLKKLGDGALSQADLARCWPDEPSDPVARHGERHIWLDGGFFTEPWPLRESSPGIEVILERDSDDVARGAVRPEEVRIPMPPVPRALRWTDWPVVGFCRVPPAECISYHPEKGARWITN
jgi:CRISPR-associated endonuclease/helicase Cas3